MPFGQPGVQDVHVDQPLSFLSIRYMNMPSAYIADRAFPIVPVNKQSDIIPEYTKDFWFRDEAQLRAPATESAGTGYEVKTTTTYFTHNYAVHKDIADELRANADSPFEPDREAVEYVTDKLRLKREVLFATDFFKTGVWATDVTGVTNFDQWSDYGQSDIITDIETGRSAIHKITGRDPNKLIVGREVWAQMKHHPDFLERIKHTQRAILTAEIIAAVLELEELLIGNAVKATNLEGATAAFSYVFGKNALLLHTPARPALLTPTAGYTFHWNRFGGISFIRRVRDDKAIYDRIEGHTHFDQKALGTDLGYFFSSAVA